MNYKKIVYSIVIGATVASQSLLTVSAADLSQYKQSIEQTNSQSRTIPSGAFATSTNDTKVNADVKSGDVTAFANFNNKNISISENLGYVPGEVIVKFKGAAPVLKTTGLNQAQAFASKSNTTVKEYVQSAHFSLMKLKGSESVEQAVERL